MKSKTCVGCNAKGTIAKVRLRDTRDPDIILATGFK